MSSKEELTSYSIRLTKSQRRKFLAKGGVRWLRSELDEYSTKRNSIDVIQEFANFHNQHKKSQESHSIEDITESDLIKIHFTISNAVKKINLELSQKETNYFKIEKILQSSTERIRKISNK